MAIKIPVVDRTPTYPGRVKLTPVQGQTDTYDLVRADSPTEPGTPINKALLDQKAYTLTENVTVYVDLALGSNDSGDGSVSKPFATIQAAVDAIPKCLGGFTATIDIAANSYYERVRIEGFYGGRLDVGVAGRAVTVAGISVFNSNLVRLNIPNLTALNTGDTGTLLYAAQNSHVMLLSAMGLDGKQRSTLGVGAEHNSTINAIGVDVTVNNCTGGGIYSAYGSKISFNSISGTNTGVGVRAINGGIVTYGSRSLAGTTGSTTAMGGRIYSGAQNNIPVY